MSTANYAVVDAPGYHGDYGLVHSVHDSLREASKASKAGHAARVIYNTPGFAPGDKFDVSVERQLVSASRFSLASPRDIYRIEVGDRFSPLGYHHSIVEGTLQDAQAEAMRLYHTPTYWAHPIRVVLKNRVVASKAPGATRWMLGR